MTFSDPNHPKPPSLFLNFGSSIASLERLTLVFNFFKPMGYINKCSQMDITYFIILFGKGEAGRFKFGIYNARGEY